MHGQVFSTTCAALLLVSIASHAASSRESQAKERFEEGTTAYQLGDFRKALSAYREAMRMSPRPSIIFNIAQCHRQLEHWKKAHFYYRLYLSEWERAHPGQRSPFAAEVQGRIAEVEAKLDDHSPASSQGAATTESEMDLGDARVAGDKEEPIGSNTGGSGFGWKRWTWIISGGTAVLTAGAAIGLGISAQSDADGAQDILNDIGARQASMDNTYRNLQSSVEDKRLVTNILWGVTGGLAALAIGMAIWDLMEGTPERRDNEPTSSAVVVPWVGGRFGMGARLVF